MALFAWEVLESGDRTVVVAHGELDTMTAPPFGEVLAAAAHMGANLVVDLSSVGFMDSSGLSVLLAASTACRREGGNLVVRNPASSVRRVLDLSGTAGLLLVEEQAVTPLR